VKPNAVKVAVQANGVYASVTSEGSRRADLDRHVYSGIWRLYNGYVARLIVPKGCTDF
jgi:hypothetical protein